MRVNENVVMLRFRKTRLCLCALINPLITGWSALRGGNKLRTPCLKSSMTELDCLCFVLQNEDLRSPAVDCGKRGSSPARAGYWSSLCKVLTHGATPPRLHLLCTKPNHLRLSVFTAPGNITTRQEKTTATPEKRQQRRMFAHIGRIYFKWSTVA